MKFPQKTIVHKQNAKRLHYWDRNESRYNPHAMAAIPTILTNDNELSVQFSPLLLTPNQIIIKLYIISRMFSLLTIKIMQANNWKQRTQQLGKKPRSLHPYPIKQVFYSRPKQSIFRGYLRLRCFQPYHLARSCPAMPYQTTGRPEAPTTRSSRTGATFPSDY